MIKREMMYLGWYFLLCIPVIILYLNFSLRSKREWMALAGHVKPKKVSDDQRREYIRLETVFPVEFQVLEGADPEKSEVFQGFTKDLSKTGMCLEVFTVRGRTLADIESNKTALRLIINLPSGAESIIATGTVRWMTKTEEITVDRHSLGISFDDITKPDLDNIIKHVLWHRRKPDLFGVAVAFAVMLILAFSGTILVLRGEGAELRSRINTAREEKGQLLKEIEEIREGSSDLEDKLKALADERSMLVAKLRSAEARARESKALAAAAQRDARAAAEEVYDEAEEADEEAPLEESAEAEEGAADEYLVDLEPVVELRRQAESEDDIVVEPNITRKMIEAEEDVYTTLRDYILADEIQLLDRYCSSNKTSIYHAAGLFALAELRYKNSAMKEMTIKAYKNVISKYPRSKYASYASHRTEQLEKSLPYTTYGLGHFRKTYNLPPLYDYRELEPYKK
jgi:hypothetical protein